MTELELLIDLHKNTKRQGPGSYEETKKALDLINLENNENLKIADIGCGSGDQTITVAQNIKGSITAVDLFPVFLDNLNKETKNLNLSNRITTKTKSMDDLDFKKEELDLIWSEGAIYIMGFENGVKYWSKFLKKNGYLAVSELTWTTNSRPKEISDYWNSAYPEIDIVSNKIKVLENNGYSPIAHFILPSHCWIDEYYKPLESEFNDFLKRHQYSTLAKKVINDTKEEIALYKKFKDYYSYGFYIAKKL